MKAITIIITVSAIGFAAGCATTGGGYYSDSGHNQEYRTFYATGKIDYGKIADSYTAELVMYVDGSQFWVVQELIQDFQKANPMVKTIYVETIPGRQILEDQILKQGRVNGKKTNQTPDLYASVTIDHLRKLKTASRMENYLIYSHNKLELMVAAGNPKRIKGPQDLARDDLVQSQPNPLSEEIFMYYGAQLLKDLGIYEKVTGGAMCKSCWAVPGKTWFTENHYRETPNRIENGEADVGIVWASEVIQAKSEDRNIGGVPIPVSDDYMNHIAYAIGILQNSKNQANAEQYLSYLQTRRAQGIFAKYGFIGASEEELEYKSL